MCKNKNAKIDKFLQKVLKKQFELVGEEYDLWEVKEREWYLKHSLTEKQEEVFHDWYANEVMKDLKLSKKQAEKEWQWWNFNYGWKRELKIK